VDSHGVASIENVLVDEGLCPHLRLLIGPERPGDVLLDGQPPLTTTCSRSRSEHDALDYRIVGGEDFSCSLDVS
jgi:hypothetical protein